MQGMVQIVVTGRRFNMIGYIGGTGRGEQIMVKALDRTHESFWNYFVIVGTHHSKTCIVLETGPCIAQLHTIGAYSFANAHVMKQFAKGRRGNVALAWQQGVNVSGEGAPTLLELIEILGNTQQMRLSPAIMLYSHPNAFTSAIFAGKD